MLWSSLLLTLSLMVPAHAGAYDVFPMDEGNFWVLTAPDGHRLIQIAASTAAGGGWYASEARGLLGIPVTLYDHQDETAVLAENPEGSVLLDFGAAGGEGWSFTVDDCASHTVKAVDGTDMVAMTPAGRFASLWVFELSLPLSSTSGCEAADAVAAPLRQVRFAEAVGPVDVLDRDGARGTLLYAVVAGEVVASAPADVAAAGDLELTLLVDTDTPEEGDDVTVALVVRNVGAVAVELDLPDAGAAPFVIDIFDRVQAQPVDAASLGTVTAADADPLEVGEYRVFSGRISTGGLEVGEHLLRATLLSGMAAEAVPLPEITVVVR